MQNNNSNSKLSLNKSSITTKSTKTLSRFKERVQEQERAQEQRKLSSSMERKVEANPWTRGTIYSQNKDNDRYGEGRERRREDSGFKERRREDSGFKERRREDRGFKERRREDRGFTERHRDDRRSFKRHEHKVRFDAKNLYDVAGDFDLNNERPERKVVDARTIYECEVPIGRMTELAICEITDKGAFVDAKDHGPLFIPRSQLPDEAKEGDLIRVFLYKDGERTLATARRPYIELGMTGNLRINSVENGTAYLDLGIPKELVLPVSEQRFRMYEGDNALVLVCIDNLGRLFGTQCFNRYIRDKAFAHEFEDNQRVKIVAVAHTPLGFRVIVDDKVYGLIYESEQKGELIIGKRYDGFVKTVRPDGRLDISLQEAGREGVEHASLDILQALYFSEGKFDFNDKSEPEKIEEYLKMSKGRFKKALGALYKQRLVEITDDGVLLTQDGSKLAEERFAQLKNKANVVSSDEQGASSSEDYDDIDALANADLGSDQDPVVDDVINAVAQARKDGKITSPSFSNNQFHGHHNHVKKEPKELVESTSWGENLDELGDFAGRRSAVNQMAGFGSERKSQRRDFGDRRRENRDFGERRREDRGFSDRRREDRGFSERRREDRGFGKRRRDDRGFGERRREDRSFGERRREDRSFGERRRDNRAHKPTSRVFRDKR